MTTCPVATLTAAPDGVVAYPEVIGAETGGVATLAGGVIRTRAFWSATCWDLWACHCWVFL